MKSFINIPLLLLSVLFFISCEKVIDVDVREADKKLVIEGVLTDQRGDCLVKISRTKSLNATNELDAVSGANVQIKDGSGVVVQLAENSAGHYRSSLVGTPGETYELTVRVGGQTYTAVSKMPQSVAIDSLYVSVMEMLGEKLYTTYIVFNDPVETGNAYRFVQYQNGVKSKTFTVLKDNLSNGRKNTVSYFNGKDDVKKGDHVKVQMQSIDLPVYNYWYSLWQGSTGEGNAASPANPVSNIRGGSLGYFSAQAVTVKEAIVQ